MTTAVRSPSPSAARKKPSFFADEASRKARRTSSLALSRSSTLHRAEWRISPSAARRARRNGRRRRRRGRGAPSTRGEARGETRCGTKAETSMRFVGDSDAGRAVPRLRRPVPLGRRAFQRHGASVGAVRKRHSPRGRAGVACAALAAPSQASPAQRERRASRAFLGLLRLDGPGGRRRARARAGALRRDRPRHGERARDQGRVPRARVRRARFFACVATSVALTAKGVAHLPDSTTPPPRTRFSGRRGFARSPPCRRSGG